MPAWLPYLANAAMMGAGFLFGGGDRTYPEQEELLRLGRYGYGPEMIKKMKNQQRMAIGNQSQALRQSAQQRLMRRNTPVQIQEGIMGDINRTGMEAISKGLTDIDIGNEEMKFRALQALMGSRQANQYDSSGLIGAGMGNMANMLMLQSLFGGGGGGNTSGGGFNAFPYGLKTGTGIGIRF